MDNRIVNSRKILHLLLAASTCVTVDAASCGGTQIIGPSNVNGYSKIDSTTASGYLLVSNDDEYKITCCGQLKEWNFRTKSNTGWVYLQVWRDTGTTWQLISETAYQVTTTSPQTHTVTLAANDQAPVETGDVIGMYFPNNNPMNFKNNGDDYKISTTAAIYNPGVGNHGNWNAGTVSTGSGRDYGINAEVDGGNSPSFTNIGATQTIADTDPISTLVITVVATDADVNDTLTYTMTSSSLYFDFNTVNREVTIKSLLDSGSYALSLSVKDHCDNTATGTLNIDVTNSPPVINNLVGASASLREDVTTETLLWTIDVTDASPYDFVECYVESPVTPASNDFFTKLNASSMEWEIYSASYPGFDFGASNTYTLTIECTDSKTTTSGTFTVNIVQNSAPAFVNLGNSTTLASSSTAIGDVIFQVLASDADDTQLFYNMTTSPATTSFEVFTTGDVIATSLITGTVASYDLSLYVYDTYSLVGPEVLSINISDVNSAPVITNLPSNISVSENSALDTSVFQVTVSDSDVGQTHLYTAVYSPDSARSLFEVDLTSGLVKTSNSKNINYDTLATPTVTIAITASDGTASDTETLTIDVQNINEAPSFEKTLYAISGNEGNSGTSFGNPAFVVLDEDVGDTHTFSIDCSTFAINSSTADVTLAQAYDLDTTGSAVSATCTVTVQDSALSATTSLSITINYVNDNSPVFAASSYYFYASNSTEVGYSIGTVSASDADIGNDGTFYYSLVNINSSADYLDMDSSGSIYVKHNLTDLVEGTVVLLTVVATDTGGLTNQTTVTIMITSITTQPTTTTTDRYRYFIEDPDNVIWVVCSTAFGIVMFFTVLYTAHQLDFIARTKRFCQELADTCRRSCRTTDTDNDSICESMSRGRTESDDDMSASEVTQEIRGNGDNSSKTWEFWTTAAEL